MTTDLEQQKRLAAGYLSTLEPFRDVHPMDLLPVVDNILASGVFCLPGAMARTSLRLEAVSIARSWTDDQQKIERVLANAEKIVKWVETGELPVEKPIDSRDSVISPKHREVNPEQWSGPGGAWMR